MKLIDNKYTLEKEDVFIKVIPSTEKDKSPNAKENYELRLYIHEGVARQMSPSMRYSLEFGDKQITWGMVTSSPYIRGWSFRHYYETLEEAKQHAHTVLADQVKSIQESLEKDIPTDGILVYI